MKESVKQMIPRPSASSPRYWVSVGVVILSFLVIGCRLFQLQVVDHHYWKQQASQRRVHRKVIVGRRGNITDCRDRPLAVSIPVKTVYADPTMIIDGHAELAAKISDLFHQDPLRVLKKIVRHKVQLASGKKVWDRYEVIARNVSLEEWQTFHKWLREWIQRKKRHLPYRTRLAYEAMLRWGFWTSDNYHREYPNGTLAGQLLGYVQPETREVHQQSVWLEVGRNGVERKWESVLQGRPGLWVNGEEKIPPQDGCTIQLTIDAVIQRIAEEELDRAGREFEARRACAIVIRPSTGKVLALANWPPFDPNYPASTKDFEWNMAISGTFDPGSTMKVITFAALLELGRVDLERDLVDCQNGYWRFAHLHDHEPFKIIRAIDVLAHSSNIGTAMLAYQRLSAAELQSFIARFGFGQRTHIGLPGEAGGPSCVPKLDKRRYIDFTRVAIGHGLVATPLQVAMAVSALANEGNLMRPMLVQAVLDEDGRAIRRYSPQTVRQVIRPSTARLLTKAMRRVAEEGTAKQLKVELPGYTVAGKTGTAKKPNAHHSYVGSRKYYASFVGFFPTTKPELCILVGVDEPNPRKGYYASQVAVPVFARIARRVASYLQIPPDRDSLPPEPPELPEREGPPAMLVGMPLEGTFFTDQLEGLP